MHADDRNANAVQGDALERLLGGTLRVVLERAGIVDVGEHDAMRSIRDIVASLDVDAEERELLDGSTDVDPDDDRERLDRWIELRLQRALREVASRKASERGLPTPTIPRIVVARRGTPGSAPIAGDLIPRIAGQSTADPSTCTLAMGGAPDDVIVLADANGIDRILERHQDLLIDDKNVRLRVRAGLDEKQQTIGLEPEPGAAGIEVFEATTLLRELCIVLEHAKLELGTVAAPKGPTETPAVADDLSGTILGGKYELVTRIGRGGFGSVYRARDLRLDNFVAVKILNREGRSLEALASLREEARRLTRIDHPNIVDWKTFDESEDGTGYIVMELLAGEDLEEVIRREGRLPADRVAHVLYEIAQALCAAHTLGDGGSILHLDLKPRNVFVLTSTDARGRERVKVIDFGIAQHGARDSSCMDEAVAGAFDPSAPDLVEDTDGTLRSARVAAMAVLDGGSSRATACTPEYAAPEHVAHLLPDVEAVALDGRADMYSLGVIGYQLLTGELPFAKVTRKRRDLLRIKTTASAPSVTSAGVKIPRDLARFVDRCLERDRDRRYPDAEAACEALRRIVTRSSTRRWLIAVSATMLLSAGVVWKSWPDVGTRRVDAFLSGTDGERTIDGERLHFGPETRDVELRIESGVGESAPAQVRLVASRAADAPDLEGTRVELVAPDLVRIHVDARPDAAARGAFLEVRGIDQRVRYSAAFALVYVPLEALRIDSAEFDGLDGRVLDPRDARLDVVVAGREDLIDRVEVVDGTRRFEARVDPVRASEDGSVWTFEPRLFLWNDGPHELAIELFDLAGTMRRHELSVDVAAGDLTWTVEGDAVTYGERWSLTPRTRAHARVSASRGADIAWRAVTESGETLAAGRKLAATSFDLDLGDVVDSAGHESFDGFLEFTVDESAYVFHAGSEASAPRRIPVQFRAEPVSVRAWISPCPTRPEIALESGAIAYVPCRKFDLRVARDCEQPLRYEIAVESAVVGSAKSTPTNGELGDRLRSSALVPLSLPNDGEYVARIRAWSTESDAEEREPEFELRATLFVQSLPSRLVAAGPKDHVVRADSDAHPRIRIAAEPAAASSGRSIAPVTVRWTLLGPGSRDVAASGALEEPLVAGASAYLALPLPALVNGRANSAEDDLDGAWRLEVSGTDAGGNESTPAVYAFHVARSGPRAEVLLPLASTAWDRGDAGYELRVSARDSNGVARVSGRVHRVDARDADIACELVRAGSNSLGTIWTGAVDLPLSWSRAEVELVVESEDGYGLKSTTRESRRIAVVEALLPPRIRVRFADREVAPLRLVRGNASGTYVFGGRGDDLENDLFRRSGLYAFNALQTSRSWHTESAPGSIEDYYVDEHEVTVGEFAEFVRSHDGFAAQHNWIDGGAPVPARARELIEASTRLDPRLPVTDVTWYEASAYAHWVGKELPSLLEWEYALRGGSAYRPHAGFDANHPELRPKFLAADRVQSVESLDDVTPDTGIWDLSANVSEWTSTSATSSTPLDGSEAVDEDARKSRRYWVAGASWASARRDFSTLDRRRGDGRAKTIGFRCRLRASDFLARLEDRNEPRFESHP